MFSLQTEKVDVQTSLNFLFLSMIENSLGNAKTIKRIR